MPEPAALEISRQITSLSNDAENAAIRLRTQKISPLLAKSRIYPSKELASKIGAELKSKTEGDWADFLNCFHSVKKLPYSKRTVDTVMRWYLDCTPPFSDKKNGEFIDAMILAILLEYSAAEDRHIAVVSTDKDFEQACDRHSHLHFYNSLSQFIESINADQKLIHAIHKANDDKLSRLESAAFEIAQSIPSRVDLGETVVNALLFSVKIEAFDILELERGNCTVHFWGNIDAHTRYEIDESTWYSGQNFTQIDGTAKLKLDEFSRKFTEIDSLALNQEEFWWSH